MNKHPDGGILAKFSAPTWVRGRARIEGDEVILVSGKPYELTIDPHHELLYDLERISTDAQEIRAFCSRHGLLWHAEEGAREPLIFWQSLAGEVHLLLTIRQALNGDLIERDERLRRYWNELRGLVVRGPEGSFSAPEDLLDYAAMDQPSAEELPQAVGTLLGAVVSARLEGVRRFLAYTEEAFSLVVEAPDLEAVAFWQLAEALASEVPIRRCPNCGRHFEASHGQQMYCSKRCSQRVRYERWKARREEEEP